MLRARSAFIVVALITFACAREHPPVVADSQTPAPAVAAPAESELQVSYLGNEGFLVELSEQRVLIDALFGEGIGGYDVVPSELRQELEQGRGQWGGVTLALASHFHRDHFNPQAVARFLEANPDAVFVSTPQAAESFAAAAPDRSDLTARFRAVLPAPGTVETLEVMGVKVEILNLDHGSGNPPTQNLGIVVTLGDKRFIHFGDTEAKMEDFEPYLALLAEADVALLPFWFLSSDWRAELIREDLRPRNLVVAHMPTRDAPAGYFARWKSYAELSELIQTRFPEAWIPSDHGQLMP